MRDFIWSEGLGLGEPWLSVVNASDQAMTATITLRLDGGGEVQTFTRPVAPLTRHAEPLKPITGDRHFWLRVRLDQVGAATLTVWDKRYTLPPYTPPPSIYDLTATTLQISAASPEPKGSH